MALVLCTRKISRNSSPISNRRWASTLEKGSSRGATSDWVPTSFQCHSLLLTTRQCCGNRSFNCATPTRPINSCTCSVDPVTFQNNILFYSQCWKECVILKDKPKTPFARGTIGCRIDLLTADGNRTATWFNQTRNTTQ